MEIEFLVDPQPVRNYAGRVIIIWLYHRYIRSGGPYMYMYIM
jgi:hypothetical protein